MVDLHYGHAEEFHIYETDGMDNRFIETRLTQKYCLGVVNCDETETIKEALIQGIADCDAVLTMRIGYETQKRLLDHGMLVIESCTSVEEGLQQAFHQLRHTEQPGAVCSGI